MLNKKATSETSSLKFGLGGQLKKKKKKLHFYL